jgi:uncharacterized protein YraI
MSSRFSAMLFLATSLAACVANDPSADETTGGGGGKADGLTPLIVFDADWNETVSGTLLAGDRMRIDYDLDRLTECRGSTNGSEVWGVTGYASFDGGEPQTFAVSQLESGRVKPVVASVEIPASATNVAMWFAINNRWGCIAYDSNENANYTFAIKRTASGAVLAFETDWTESQSDAIHAGDHVVVHYDPERLSECASSSGGHPTWAVTGYWRVDGGTIKTVAVARVEGSALVAADATIAVPRGHDLELWFEATSTYGCHAYDSNLGANYHFAIE